MSDIAIGFDTRKQITGNIPQAVKDIQRARFVFRFQDASGSWPIHEHSEAAVIRVANSEIAKPSVCVHVEDCVCMYECIYIYIYMCVCVYENMERIFIQSVPLATEPGISLIILPLMRILQRNLKRTYLIV
jgi:hypothetical protein